MYIGLHVKYRLFLSDVNGTSIMKVLRQAFSSLNSKHYDNNNNIVRVIKWAGHVARMGEESGCIGSWWGNRRERDHWGDLGTDG